MAVPKTNMPTIGGSGTRPGLAPMPAAPKPTGGAVMGGAMPAAPAPRLNGIGQGLSGPPKPPKMPGGGLAGQGMSGPPKPPAMPGYNPKPPKTNAPVKLAPKPITKAPPVAAPKAKAKPKPKAAPSGGFDTNKSSSVARRGKSKAIRQAAMRKMIGRNA